MTHTPESLSAELRKRASSHGKMVGNNGFYTASDALTDHQAADLIERQAAIIAAKDEALAFYATGFLRFSENRATINGVKARIWWESTSALDRDHGRRAAEAHALTLENADQTKGESAPVEPPRDPCRLPARDLTDAELVVEQTRVEKLWDEMHEPDPETGEEFEGHGGSPGEWMVERMDEIATEQSRRAAENADQTTSKREG